MESGALGEADEGRILVRTLRQQGSIGLLYLGPDLRILGGILDPAAFRGLAAQRGVLVTDLIPEEDRAALSDELVDVLATGQPRVGPDRPPQRIKDRDLYVALSVLRYADERRRLLVVTLVDVTAGVQAQNDFDLAFEAAHAIGSSLSMTETAQQIADILARRYDMVIVDLAEEVLDGDTPVLRGGGGNLSLRRAAVAPADEPWPPGFVVTGETVPPVPDTPQVRLHQRGQAGALSGRAAIYEQLGDDPSVIHALVPDRDTPHLAFCASALATPGERPLILGAIQAWLRDRDFTQRDVEVFREIARRAAAGIDNARRFIREHRTSLALQRRLLPAAPATTAVEVAARYLPATDAGVGVGGDWYDVIPLPSLRVALVVGDAVGHGLPPVAHMARMRAAVQTLADMDLPPDELLAHLDDLVDRMSAEDELGTLGSTCLVIIYDPIAGRCEMASAGHPPPILLTPTSGPRILSPPIEPPLGLGGHPWETQEIPVAPGTVLALYSDGMITLPDLDVEEGLHALADRLGETDPAGSLEDIATHATADFKPTRDDGTIMIVRLGAIDPNDVATREFPAGEAEVAAAREWATTQIKAWGAPIDTEFSTELVVSELVTNAVRYGGGENVTLRLIHDQDRDRLICEVTDDSSTAPHLRRARSTDEGGRGLMIVAQLSKRWGARHRPNGKVIWAELTCGCRRRLGRGEDDARSMTPMASAA